MASRLSQRLCPLTRAGSAARRTSNSPTSTAGTSQTGPSEERFGTATRRTIEIAMKNAERRHDRPARLEEHALLWFWRRGRQAGLGLAVPAARVSGSAGRLSSA